MNEVIKLEQSCGLEQHSAEDNRNNVPMDFRFLDLEKLAGDPEIGIGSYAQGVGVGPGIRRLFSGRNVVGVFQNK